MIKVCGNCRWHSPYAYPDRIVCFSTPVKVNSTLRNACKDWVKKDQACYCIMDTLRKNGEKNGEKVDEDEIKVLYWKGQDV